MVAIRIRLSHTRLVMYRYLLTSALFVAFSGLLSPVFAEAPSNFQAAKQALDANKLGHAVFICDGLEKKSLLQVGQKPTCAKAHLGLGDRLAKAGAIKDAIRHWHEAGRLDPRLLDDPAFLKRLTMKPQAKKPTPPAVKVEPSPQPAPKPKKVRVTPPKKPRAWKPGQASKPQGVRTGRRFGLGLGFGFDGLTSFVLGWMHQGWLSVEVSVGILFRTVDTRVRIYGSTSDAVTPVIGFGMTTALGADARFELDIPGFQDLYRLGQTLHLDLGVSWSVWKMEVFAGMALLTTLDQEHFDRLLFFPQFAVQGLIYF